MYYSILPSNFFSFFKLRFLLVYSFFSNVKLVILLLICFISLLFLSFLFFIPTGKITSTFSFQLLLNINTAYKTKITHIIYCSLQMSLESLYPSSAESEKCCHQSLMPSEHESIQDKEEKRNLFKSFFK